MMTAAGNSLQLLRPYFLPVPHSHAAAVRLLQSVPLEQCPVGALHGPIQVAALKSVITFDFRSVCDAWPSCSLEIDHPTST